MMTNRAAPQGEMRLEKMLAELAIEVRPGTFTFLSTDAAVPAHEVCAMITEAEGTTLVLEVGTAIAHGLPVDFEAAWLTVNVHSALEAVGLTAALSVALAASDIPCNVLSGFFHDHLLVPADRASEAVAVLNRLPNTSSGLS